MTDAKEETGFLGKYQQYIYCASLYCVGVGILYLWGYWGKFDINILEYTSLTDVIRVTIYPVCLTATAVVLGALASHTMHSSRSQNAAKNDMTELRKKVALAVRKWNHAIKISYFFFVASVAIFGLDGKWYVLPALIALPISIVADEKRILASIISDLDARRLTLYILCTLPIWAYGQGRIQASFLQNGVSFKYLAMDIDDKFPAGESKDPLQRVKFIGHMGDYIFLLQPDNETVAILRFDQIKSLQLKQYKKAGPEHVEDILSIK